MKLNHYLSLAAAVTLLPVTSLSAQMTGVSTPAEDNPTTSASDDHYTKPAASSSTLSVRSHTTEEPVVYGPYKPYVAPGAPVSAPAPASSPILAASATSPFVVTNDVNSGIVTMAPVSANELPMGTILKAELQQTISTLTTKNGTRFSAVVTADVPSRDGSILIPSGTLIHGRVTRLIGGRRIGGPAAIRLQADNLSLPDGTTYKFSAELTGLEHSRTSHVNAEGTIVANPHHAATVLAFGLTTSAAAVTGGMIGGGVGAVVGLGVGAGAATILWLKHNNHEELPSGTGIVFTLGDSLHVNPAARS